MPAIEQPDVPAEGTSTRRDRLMDGLCEVGIRPALACRALTNATNDQLLLLESLMRSLEPRARASVAAPSRNYGQFFERIGREYVGYLTPERLAQFDASMLPENVRFLSTTAHMIHGLPHSERDAMWPVMRSRLDRSGSHYQAISRAIVQSGLADALEADNYQALTGLSRDALPPLDVDVLRMAGVPDPEEALEQFVRRARLGVERLPEASSVQQVLEEGAKHLEPQPADASPPRPKRWVGWSKLLTGASLAGANIAGGAALALGGGPLAASITIGGVITSCGAGFGGILEGVGALREG